MTNEIGNDMTELTSRGLLGRGVVQHSVGVLD